ncbi:MAG: hypothetical protein E6I88_01875 [Chloroflexi bacterium]|nr:MAG: hypothetical protein E6I88_01875 [Chloroflexota bacterium]
MFSITTKAKVAAGIAAGALTLGAAGAYAANANNNGSIPATSLKAVTITGASGLTLMSTTGKTTSLTIPATFKNQGQCISLFAKHQDLVVAPAAGSTARISKNAHGKLISTTIKAWCQTQLGSTTKASDSTETPDAAQSAAPETDATDQSGTTHGHGHGYGHSKHTAN